MLTTKTASSWSNALDEPGLFNIDAPNDDQCGLFDVGAPGYANDNQCALKEHVVASLEAFKLANPVRRQHCLLPLALNPHLDPPTPLSPSTPFEPYLITHT